MQKKMLLRKKTVAISLLSIAIVVLTSTAVPAVFSDKNINLITSQGKIQQYKENKLDLPNFLKKIINRNDIQKQEVLNRFNTKFKSELITPILDTTLNNFEENIGTDLYMLYLSIFDYVIKHFDSNNRTILTYHQLFSDEMQKYYLEFQELNNGRMTLQELSPSLKETIEIFNNSICFNQTGEPTNYNNDFEKYWTYYGRAKGYWAAYLPPIDSRQRTPSRDRGLILWSAHNYNDWYFKAGTQIWGDEDSGQMSLLHQMNLFMLIFDIIFPGIIGTVFAVIGTLTLQAAFLLTSTVLYGLGVFFTAFLLWYDVLNLYYFLFGVNAFYTLFDRRVDIVIDVLDANQIPIENCKIIAYSADADKKSEISPGWDGWESGKSRWNWSKSEFQYILGATDGEGKGCYTLNDRAEPKYKKAVPPPGYWNLTIVPPEDYEGEDENGIPKNMVGPISPNHSWNIIVQLNVTKKK